ncbi:imidazole glycerol phosphate synthase subunit HisF [Prochlorococcus marinus]|uniref:imidazole glycerol phosphate synthase subunit HisF n=1 Tax=Prochlorococcus marinus TaxID=1219 RepID=UPI0039AF4D19
MRIISRLDIKGDNLIKGVQLEGLRVLGDPLEFARKYYFEGADEIIYIDCVASLYGQNHLHSLISDVSKSTFIPTTVGGGVRSVEDIRKLLLTGADKVTINTSAVQDPDLIQNASKEFGSQCIVSSIQAKRIKPGHWNALIENGREESGLDVLKWALKVQDLGAGEILLTSVDNDGTMGGLDFDLINKVNNIVDIPVIVSGGFCIDDVEKLENNLINAIAIGSSLHYKKTSLKEVKDKLNQKGIEVRM